MKRGILRVAVGAIAGACGAIGLALTIFPFVVGKVFPDLSIEALFGPDNSIMPLVVLWALGGGIVGWLGGIREGGLILGACGLLAGLTLSLITMPPVWNLAIVILGMLIGLIYGSTGGLIMGRVFPKPGDYTG